MPCIYTYKNYLDLSLLFQLNVANYEKFAFVGDAVFGLAGGCLGSHVDASAYTLVPMPSTLNFEAAATTPTVFITVDTAFRQAANVQPGERVLVHAAAGGVGLAAIQQAAALGGVVIATAGSTNKRNLVRSLGAQEALGSRDTMFVGELAALGGADVVLNSLTSSGMVAGSVAGLRRGGRFIEISKRDIWSGARLAQERPDVLYTLVAVDFLPDKAVHQAMTRLSGHLATGTLQPLPQVVHSLAAARAALRQMSQARHVGKVVVRGRTLQQDRGTTQGTAIVTGGLGMIGSLVCAWLAKQSVERIVLLGRSGRPGADSGAATALALGGALACISMVRCDASSAEEVHALALSSCGKDNLQAVFHSGGVLADATLPNQTLGRIRSVLAPKVDSAQLWGTQAGLQPTTAHVVFSSVAALLGSPGQANYSAVNSILDAMAETWQAQGASGLSVQWGAWAEGGMAAANAATAKAVEKMGMGMVDPESGMGTMQSMLMQTSALAAPIYSAIPFKWSTFMARLPAVPPMFANFADFWHGSDKAEKQGSSLAYSSSENVPSLFGAPQNSAGQQVPVRSTKAVRSAAGVVAAATAGPSLESLSSQVHESVRSVLGSSVGGDDPLMSAGLDSLGSVELKNALERRSGVDLPSTLVFDYPTVNALAGFLVGKLATTAVASAESDLEQETQFSSIDGMFMGESELAVPFDLQAKVSTGIQLVGVGSLVSRSANNALTQIMPADCPTAVPLNRWDVEAQAELCAGIPVQFGVFLSEVAAFDAAAFSLSDTEAALMDPQQRLLLETVAEAGLPYSGLLAEESLRANWGVFVVSLSFFEC